MLLTDNLYERILVDPQRQNPEINSLLVVSGYATAAMASYYIEDLQNKEMEIKTNLIVGMTPRNGLRESDHRGFVDLATTYPNKFSCNYIMNNHNPVHSKLYVLCENETPRMAFTGSANYTQTALFSRQSELVTNCDPTAGFEYFHTFDSHTIHCTHPEAADYITVYKGKSPERGYVHAPQVESPPDFPSTVVSFLTGEGTVGNRSGLNWGQRPEEGRNPNQAYIPLKATIYRSDFFPDIGNHFTVLTDDDKTLICSRAQQSGKAIHTPLNNSQMGEYFRNRLGVPSGEIVTIEHFQRYGRSDIEFFKLDEENYYMDFSSNQNR